MSWDYELAKEIRRGGRATPSPALLRGTVVKLSPLTVSLCDGEVMAPPLPLACVSSAQGTWTIGQEVICGIVDNSAVILGRL